MSEDLRGELLSPEEADRLLKRAAELDVSRSSAISLEQLRQSAVDAGIDASAFDAALRESRLARPEIPANTTTTASLPTPASKSLWQKMSVVGLSLGVITQLVRPFSRIDGLQIDRIGAATILLSAFAYLLLRHGRGSRHRLFQGDLAALFTTFFAGAWIANGGAESAGPWVAMVSIAAWLWAGTGVLGAALLRFRKAGAEPGDAADLALPVDPDPLQNEARPDQGRRVESNRLEVRSGVQAVPAFRANV
jgi:hypothetical protein